MEKRPGFLLYFDIRPALERLNDAERGQWLLAVINYAEFGALPSELGGMVGMAFDMFKPTVDRDAERYDGRVLKNRYAVFCREEQKRGETPCSFDEFKERCNQTISLDIERYPTTTTASAPTPTTTPTPTTAAAATTAPTTATARASTPTAAGELTEEYHKITNDEFNRLRNEKLAALMGSASAPPRQ